MEADRTHLSVPRTFRRILPKQFTPAPVLHRRELEWQRDVTFSDRGFKVTTVPRTIIDIAALVDPDHLALTLQDAFRRGYLSPDSTRARDLPDMVALIREGALDRETSGGVIAETFRRRGTHDLPAELVLPPGFETAFTRYGEGYGLDGMTPEEGIAVLTKFLEEIGVLKPA